MVQSRKPGARPKRRREMDLMGMLIVVGLVCLQSALVFGGPDHYVKNTQQGMAAETVANLFLVYGSMWGMPLMMLITGAAIWYSLRKRTAGQFLLNRVQRLLIPSVIVLGTLVIILVVHDIAARRTRSTRFLFGLRLAKTQS